VANNKLDVIRLQNAFEKLFELLAYKAEKSKLGVIEINSLQHAYLLMQVEKCF